MINKPTRSEIKVPVIIFDKIVFNTNTIESFMERALGDLHENFASPARENAISHMKDWACDMNILEDDNAQISIGVRPFEVIPATIFHTGQSVYFLIITDHKENKQYHISLNGILDSLGLDEDELKRRVEDDKDI